MKNIEKLVSKQWQLVILVQVLNSDDKKHDYRLSVLGAGYGFMYPGLVLVIWTTLLLIWDTCSKNAL